jgi:putative membrane protein
VLTSLAIATAHLGPGHFGGFGFLFFLVPLFWIALFAILFATVGRRWRRRAWAHGGPYGHGGPWSAGRRAEVTLAERFANGDIDEVEYRARLEVLRANSVDGPPAA